MTYLSFSVPLGYVDTFQQEAEAMFKGAATAKGALVITPEKVIVTTPGADNKKEL